MHVLSLSLSLQIGMFIKRAKKWMGVNLPFCDWFGWTDMSQIAYIYMYIV